MDTKAEVRTAMSLEMLQFDSPENPTQLAEWAAHEFDSDSWLDDELHFVWELALEFFDYE